MSCKTCAYPKTLCFAVYCKKDPELRNLPASVGDIDGKPLIQAAAPAWCPLTTPAISCPPSCA